MLEISNLRLPLDAGLSHGEDLLRRRIAKAIGCEPLRVADMRLLKAQRGRAQENDVHFVATYAFSLTGADELDAARRGMQASGASEAS